jgi:glutaredoxin
MLLIYTKPICPQCEQVKSLVTELGIDYDAVEVDADSRDYLVSLGIRSVPAVFDGDTYMGGLKEVREYLKHKGEANE